MKHIGKILKKYTFSILVIIVLLVIQAQCDLKLPEYTSDIINVGIQSKGVETPVYEKVSKTTLDCVVAMAGDQSIYDYYELDDDVYVLKDKKNTDDLEKIMVRPIVKYYLYSKMAGSISDASGMVFDTTNETNVEMKKQLEEYSSKIDALDDTMLSQYAIQAVIDEYENIGVDINQMQMNYLFRVGGLMLLLTVFVCFIIIATAYMSSRVAASFGYDLREEMVKKVTYFSNEDVNKFNTSSLITRCTNDITQIQNMLTMLLRMIMYAPIIGIGAVIKLTSSNAGMAWVIGAAIGVIILMLLILLFVAMPKFRLVQKLIDRINQIVREQLNGLPVIRAFANEELETEKFNSANEELTKVNLFTSKVMAFMAPVMTIVMDGTMVLVYWVALSKIDNGTLQVGTLTAFLTYTMHIIMSFMMLSMLSIMGPRAMISLNRISEVLDTETKLKEKKHTREFVENKKGTVEFKNVSFKFPDGKDYVLDDITFSVKKGTTTAIIGATGSGKTALVNLIPRFYDVSKGAVYVDGIDVKDAKFKDLRNLVAYVPQKGYLFSGTAKSNIKFGDENISDERMKAAADIACASEFIEDKDEKYDFEISQGGTNVSGGQKQRLCIARAIVKDSEILILDDSLSALDYKTDATVRKNLQNECSDMTKIIVAQRVATVMNADQIIVLDKGKIVGKGKHKDLYKNCKVYKEIALSQLKEEELV